MRTWFQYKSKYEGDLVAKCYYAKHKLVWEVLEGGLKSKIEIQWSDIMAMKAVYSDDGPDTLTVVVIFSSILCTVYECMFIRNLFIWILACISLN